MIKTKLEIRLFLNGCEDSLILFGCFDQTRANSITGQIGRLLFVKGGLIVYLANYMHRQRSQPAFNKSNWNFDLSR